MADFDEDLAAVFLGALDILPSVEVGPALKADNISPAVGPVGLDPLGNRGGLCLPELIRIRKDAMLAKEVGSDLSLIGIKIEQGLVGRDRRSARDPSLARPPHRGAFGFALEEAKPFGLLFWRRKRKRADRFAVQFVFGVEFPYRFVERSKREHTAHQKLSHSEEAGYILQRLAFIVEALERLILLHFCRRQASDIFDDRCRNRGGRILFSHDRAWNERHLACLLRDFFERKKTAASGDDAIIFAFAANEQSLTQSALPDGRQNVGYVRLLAPMPHIEFGNPKLVERDVFEVGLCHGGLLFWRVKRETQRPRGASPVDLGEGKAVRVPAWLGVGLAPVIIADRDQRRAALDPDFGDLGLGNDKRHTGPWAEQFSEGAGRAHVAAQPVTVAASREAAARPASSASGSSSFATVVR